ncbi:hypothetical protein A0H81_14295 [Grifola frondosa]|uniref:Uncharacterized protein n=1 Tax=Grifola frondosa TaxID=5627 RepID=A0A1C7LLX3_GRIFR|nr:hypothetical protein A0H81_14295 [Grifola frondosa]
MDSILSADFWESVLMPGSSNTMESLEWWFRVWSRRERAHHAAHVDVPAAFRHEHACAGQAKCRAQRARPRRRVRHRAAAVKSHGREYQYVNPVTIEHS